MLPLSPDQEIGFVSRTPTGRTRPKPPESLETAVEPRKLASFDTHVRAKRPAPPRGPAARPEAKLGSFCTPGRAAPV